MAKPRRSSKAWLTKGIWILSVLLICVSVLAVWIGRDVPAGEDDAPGQTEGSTAAQITESTTESTVEPVTEPSAESTSKPVTNPTAKPTDTTAGDAQADPPAALTAMLECGGNTYEELAHSGCNQLVTVVADGKKAEIRFFSCTDGQWVELEQMRTAGYVGRNGVSDHKREGDGCTPSGLYSVGTGFYINKKPTTQLDLFKITPDTYWVDDPDSAYYNQRVEGTQNKDWTSAEKMGSYTTAYQYGFVVDYNTDCVPGAGSAIFFHVGSKATAGCIATKEKSVLSYLSVLDQSKQPYILILMAEDLGQLQ